jgi:hypothetical protein
MLHVSILQGLGGFVDHDDPLSHSRALCLCFRLFAGNAINKLLPQSIVHVLIFCRNDSRSVQHMGKGTHIMTVHDLTDILDQSDAD